MILWRNVTASGAQINTGLIHPAIPVLEFVGGGARRQGQQLIPQTNAKNRPGWFQLQRVTNGRNGFGTHGGVAGSVGQKESVPFNPGRIGFQIVVVGYDGQFDFMDIDKVSDDIELHTTIVGDDAGCIPLSIDGHVWHRHFGHQMPFVGILIEGHKVGLWILIERERMNKRERENEQKRERENETAG